MAGRYRAPKGARRPARAPTHVEWIGGRISPPFFIHDREEPYRTELVTWMEVPSGLVVGQEAVDPRESAGAVARVLQAALGDAIPVLVAPTPELDDLLELMLESLPHEPGDESYLDGGRIPPGIVESLFAASQILYRMAPWKVASDDQVLRMDIPALGVDGACVSIIGQLEQSRGALIFPSLAGYEAFLRAAEKPRPRRRRVDFGTGWLALGFERAADLPAPMRREAEIHGWPVADSDGASRPLVERDFAIATACASSLSAFFVKHRALFEADELEPVCESYFDRQDLEVRFTFPYEAFPLFDVGDASERRTAPTAGPGRAMVGRNAPCPCGSGRKYKKCHLSVDEQERATRSGGDAHHDLDARLIHELTRFAEKRFGSEWRRFERDFADASEALQLSVPWSVYQYRVREATVLEWYAEEQGRELTQAERTWLAAQQAAWLSIWEVTEADPGASLTLHDRLSGEVRHVREVSGSPSSTTWSDPMTTRTPPSTSSFGRATRSTRAGRAR